MKYIEHSPFPVACSWGGGNWKNMMQIKSTNVNFLPDVFRHFILNWLQQVCGVEFNAIQPLPLTFHSPEFVSFEQIPSFVALFYIITSTWMSFPVKLALYLAVNTLLLLSIFFSPFIWSILCCLWIWSTTLTFLEMLK